MQGRDLKVEMVKELVWLPQTDQLTFWAEHGRERFCAMTFASISLLKRYPWRARLVATLNGEHTPEVPIGWVYTERGIISLDGQRLLVIAQAIRPVVTDALASHIVDALQRTKSYKGIPQCSG